MKNIFRTTWQWLAHYCNVATATLALFPVTIIVILRAMILQQSDNIRAFNIFCLKSGIGLIFGCVAILIAKRIIKLNDDRSMMRGSLVIIMLVGMILVCPSAAYFLERR